MLLNFHKSHVYRGSMTERDQNSTCLAAVPDALGIDFLKIVSCLISPSPPSLSESMRADINTHSLQRYQFIRSPSLVYFHCKQVVSHLHYQALEQFLKMGTTISIADYSDPLQSSESCPNIRIHGKFSHSWIPVEHIWNFALPFSLQCFCYLLPPAISVSNQKRKTKSSQGKLCYSSLMLYKSVLL